MFGSFLRAVGLGDFARGFGGGARAAAPASSEQGPPLGSDAWIAQHTVGQAGQPPAVTVAQGPPPAPPPAPEQYLYTLPDGRQVPWIPFIHPSAQGQIQAGGQIPLRAFGTFGVRAPALGSPWGRQSPTPYPGLSSSSYAGRQSSTPYPGFGSSPMPYPGWRY